MKKILLISLIVIFMLAFGNFVIQKILHKETEISAEEETERNKAEEIIVPQDRVEKIEIIDNSTFGNLMATSGISYALAMEIYEASKEVYDLTKIRSGRYIKLVFDKDDDKLKELSYKVDTEDELHVRNSKYFITGENNLELSSEASELSSKLLWESKIEPIPYEIKNKIAEGEIESSMYQAALDNDIDIRAIIELANAFQWSIDFAMDPRVGDKFRFVYEERYLDGEYIMPGQVFAGVYVNSGKEFFVYYFEEDKDNIGFFDSDGNSVQKMFLKAPVEFKYISSGFTTGLRYIKAFNVSTGHRAIDYAAALGTPIRAVGNGTVTYAGWSRAGYGNLLSIRHNSTYSTNYAHLSKFAVKSGQKVSQGQVIGYVGSTGFSTGPHLHYEMVKNGVKINPLAEVLPPGKPIKPENMGRFKETVAKWVEDLKIE